MNRSRKFFVGGLVAVLWLSVLNAGAGEPITPEWTSVVDGGYPYIDRPTKIVVDAAGNSYVTGATSEIVDSWADILTTKISPSGETLWKRRIDGPAHGTDQATSIAVDLFGNVYVAGTVDSGATSDDMLLVKYDSLGNEKWRVSFDGNLSSPDRVNAIAIAPDGSIYLTGSAWVVAFQGTDILTAKFSTDGNLIWKKSYGCETDINRAGNDSGNTIGLDHLGNIYIGATCWMRPEGVAHVYDFSLLKYDSEGNRIWDQPVHYNGPKGDGYDVVQGMAIDENDDVYLTGKSEGITDYDLATIKVSHDGVLQWVSRYSGIGESNDSQSFLTLDPQGNPVITGQSSTGAGVQSEDIVTIKYNKSTGSQIWQAVYNGPVNGSDQPNSISIDTLGNIYVSGTTYVMSLRYDYLLLKYNSQGVEELATTFDGFAGYGGFAAASAIDANGSVFVTGSCYTGTEEEFVTLKYSQLTGVHQESVGAPSSYSLSQNYPNPFNPTTTIDYLVPKKSHVLIQVMDMAGRIVSTLVNDTKHAGQYSVKFDASSFASGTYVYTIKGEGFSESKKMILVK